MVKSEPIYQLISRVRLNYVTQSRGGKNRRALLAGNVKQQEIRLNEDLILKM